MSVFPFSCLNCDWSVVTEQYIDGLLQRAEHRKQCLDERLKQEELSRWRRFQQALNRKR